MVELLVIMALLALMALLARPSYRRFILAMRLRAATNVVKNQLVAAKSRAVANPQTHCGVHFDPSADPPRSFMFFDKDNTNGYSAADRRYLGTEELPEGVTMTVNNMLNNAIVYRGDGSARHGGSITLSDGHAGKTIDVLAATGRIRTQ